MGNQAIRNVKDRLKRRRQGDTTINLLIADVEELVMAAEGAQAPAQVIAQEHKEVEKKSREGKQDSFTHRKLNRTGKQTGFSREEA